MWSSAKELRDAEALCRVPSGCCCVPGKRWLIFERRPSSDSHRFSSGAVEAAAMKWPRVVFGEGPAIRPGLVVGVGEPGDALTMHAYTQWYIQVHLGAFNFTRVEIKKVSILFCSWYMLLSPPPPPPFFVFLFSSSVVALRKGGLTATL